MKKPLISGMVVLAILSGLGLFLVKGAASPYFFPFLVALLFLLVSLASLRFIFHETVEPFLFMAWGILCLNLVVQITGGASSPALFAYFIIVVAAAFRSWKEAAGAAAVILAIEAANLLQAGAAAAVRWPLYGGFAFSLAAAAGIAAPLVERKRRKVRRAEAEYENLLAAARSVDPLAGGLKLDAFTEQGRQASNVSAAVEREGAFHSLIDMIAGMVPAHTYALFLAEGSDGRFILRAIRSASRHIPSVGTAEVTRGKGLIGICIDKNRPQYVSELVIPAKNLGYYTENAAVRSLLAVPLAQGDVNAGILVVDSLEPDAFPPALQDALSRFVPFFLQIIDKVRITRELDMRARNFQALHEMSEVLSSSLELDKILKKLAGQVRSVVASDFCAFILYDMVSDEAVLTALEGYGSRFENHRFPIEQSVVLSHMLKQWRDQAASGQYYFSDLGKRGREIDLFPIRELQQPLQSLFGRPLVARGKFIGAFFLGSFRSDAFSEYNREFLGTLMNQVSVVIDNSMLYEDIRNKSRQDGLTGLLNHRTFMEKLKDETLRLSRDQKPFSLLLVDIDHFKKVNDTYGHPAGDAVLVRVAGILKEAARGADFVARYGGEEFAVGMVGADARGARQMAERLRKTVERTVITVGRAAISVTLSIGIASHPDDSAGAAGLQSLVGLADAALYHAKRTGRNQVCLSRDAKAAEKQAPVA